MTFLGGQLLVAAPALMDPNFTRTVIAVASHDEEGALGVVLNRCADVSLRDSAPDLSEVIGDDDRLFLGGPVQADSIVLMAEFDDPDESRLVVTGKVGLVSEQTQIERLTTLAGRRRAFAGYAGWSQGQLEMEVDREDWFVTPVLPDDLFSDSPETLWSDVLERMGGEYRLVARMPVDVSVN